MKQISDNEIYMLIKYIKSVLWRVVKRLSLYREAQCLKVKLLVTTKSKRSPKDVLTTLSIMTDVSLEVITPRLIFSQALILQ